MIEQKKEILSPPPYAADNDVHFGRWQSFSKRPSPSLSSPTLSQTSNNSSFSTLPPITFESDKLQCRLPPLNEILRNSHKDIYPFFT